MAHNQFSNRLTRLFRTKYPIVQAGMIWASGWRLAAAVSQCGGLGVIGAGSMSAETLRTHIRRCRLALTPTQTNTSTTNAISSSNSSSTSTSTHDDECLPFAVNMPLLHPNIKAHMQVVMEERVPIVFTSAGSPASWTALLQAGGTKVVHVVSSSKFALKAQDCGVDAVVAEGFEAGGHNGREETTTLVLVPGVAQAVHIPVIAAGGIYDGRSMLASMVLGADGVQIGTRFVASVEASSHQNFKDAVIRAQEGDTKLMMKNVAPVRLLRNKFFDDVASYEARGASAEEMKTLLGRGRSRVGMFEGNLDEGDLEIGQASALVREILPAGRIVEDIWGEFQSALNSPLRQK